MNITLTPNATFAVDVVMPTMAALDVVIPDPISLGVVGLPGPPGPEGPQGIPGEDATQIVSIPYDEWPPISPLPNTLYLRLAE
jgi:hypothetical protein